MMEAWDGIQNYIFSIEEMRNLSQSLLQAKIDSAPLASYYHLLQSSTALHPYRQPYLTHRIVNNI